MFFPDDLSDVTFLASISVAFACYALFIRSGNSPINQIPTLGPPGTIGLFIGAVKSYFYGYKMVEEGYYKYPIFRLPTYFSWVVIVTGRDHLEDIRKATDEQMSFMDAVEQFAQTEYTISPRLKVDLVRTINVVRGPMTRNIGTRFPDLLDELDKALGGRLQGADEGWLDLPCYSSAVHIVSRLITRFFVGPELSSDSKYTRTMQEYTVHVMRTGILLRFFPTWLRHSANRVLFDSIRKTRDIEDCLRPVLMKRLEKGMGNKAGADDSNDMITWLWDTLPESQRTLHDLAIRIIFLNIVAIDTTSALLTHILFSLATYSSYIGPLREEISTIIQADGWNKISIEKMRKLDSFVKETQRLHGSEAFMSLRFVKDDFTFSDGTFIPKGATIVLAGRAVNHDKRYYSDPTEFQGFRFVDKDPLKWQMTALNPEYMVFGVGRHACPGRFFAITELKAIAARILLDYDIKLTEEAKGRPKEAWTMGFFVEPNKKARISLRKRSKRNSPRED